MNEPEPYSFPFAKLFDLNPNVIAEEPSFYTATFSRDREEQFVVKDRETFFTSAQRSQIAFQILLRTKYDEEKKVRDFIWFCSTYIFVLLKFG